MLETLDTNPDRRVHDAEYRRLFGFPRPHVPGERPRELAAWARPWYAEHRRPWVYLREAKLEIAGETLRLDGVEFRSRQLHEHLLLAGARRAWCRAKPAPSRRASTDGHPIATPGPGGGSGSHGDVRARRDRRRPRPMTKLCASNPAAKDKLPPAISDKSGIGVHDVDAFIAPMNAALPDNTRVSCKRKGLRITLRVGAKKGDGLMRRLTVSRDPVAMLQVALQEAAQAAGVQLQITDTEILLGL